MARKEGAIRVHVEYLIEEKLRELAATKGLSASEYMRKLGIEALIAADRLDKEELVILTTS